VVTDVNYYLGMRGGFRSCNIVRFWMNVGTLVNFEV
jgi:hypothetical protein